MRKLFHIEAIVDHTIAWDIANIASKKAVKFEMRPVVHGGEDEETGELKARPTGKEIVLALARSGKSFVIKDAIAEVKRVGGSPHSIYAACADLKRDKRLKRIGPGEYQLIREVGEKACLLYTSPSPRDS